MSHTKTFHRGSTLSAIGTTLLGLALCIYQDQYGYGIRENPYYPMKKGIAISANELMLPNILIVTLAIMWTNCLGLVLGYAFQSR